MNTFVFLLISLVKNDAYLNQYGIFPDACAFLTLSSSVLFRQTSVLFQQISVLFQHTTVCDAACFQDHNLDMEQGLKQLWFMDLDAVSFFQCLLSQMTNSHVMTAAHRRQE